jgi:acetyl esterase/lipase
MKSLLLLLFSVALQTSGALGWAAEAGGVKLLADVPYKVGGQLSDYEMDRCKLDLYLPEGKKGYPTLVWFHGGGLTGGAKNGKDTVAVVRSLAAAGVAVVSVNYRLSPKAQYPAYIEDSAAAFAWVKSHIAEHDGDAGRVFVGGHSAGGYLTFMIGLDERYLRAHGLELTAIAGLIPVSGQTMTHYTVRQERGIGKFTITADEAAPVFYARKATPPMLVLYADQDMAARAEENAYLVAVIQATGNLGCTGLLVHDRNHGTIASRMANADDKARVAMLDFMADPARYSLAHKPGKVLTQP